MFAPLIRPAIADDLETIVDQNVRLALESEEMQLDVDTVRRGVSALLRDEKLGRYFVACLENRIVGQLMLTTEWSDWRCGHFWWIQSVYVQPEARRRGIFKGLHACVIADAERRRDVIGVRLYVEEHNEAAQRTYERVGMRGGVYKVMEQTLPK